ncbi:Protein EARLY FLOWERING 4 [Camellia lanceoleosa]|uniref:Protein EARLY FLOWERING 4 n=1 Tax=Camellia lanceoleosa TaxID=1840588 RepID=A0ACC0HT47_9ERIC|nr:Protein EARLY FLOWERING 4 [Camellia lanceoleosa]
MTALISAQPLERVREREADLCMTTIESSSAVESSMEDTSQTLTNHQFSNNTNRNGRGRRIGGGGGDDVVSGDDEEFRGEECDNEAWDTLSKSFRQVQSVLDQNRALIQQVNENHQSKMPDNLVKNVALIREINGNISKVMSLYSDLSVDFSNIVQQRRAINNDDHVEKIAGS